MQPILVFTKLSNEDKRCIYNVGRGAALNIVVAKRPKDGTQDDWKEPTRYPPLPPNSWVECYTGYEIACDYSDADDNPYTSKCMHFKTTAKKGKTLPDWPDGEINKVSLVPKML
jgi:hypothetical protein